MKKLTKKVRKEIAAYVRENVEDYELRLQLALNRMDRMRCSLRYVDSELFEAILERIEEWCEDNDFALYDFFDDADDMIEGDEGIIWEE